MELLTIGVTALVASGLTWLCKQGCNEHHWGERDLTHPDKPDNWNLCGVPAHTKGFIRGYQGDKVDFEDGVTGIILERYSEKYCKHNGCTATKRRRENYAYLTMDDLEEYKI